MLCTCLIWWYHIKMAKHRTRRSKSERLQQAQIPIRHRYQIDSKINKTFIFGFLSHTLIASYAIDIFSFQSISSHITHPSWWKGLSYVLFCLLSPLLHFQANLSTLKALGLTFPSHIKFRGALLYHIHPETHQPTAGDAFLFQVMKLYFRDALYQCWFSEWNHHQITTESGVKN